MSGAVTPCIEKNATHSGGYARVTFEGKRVYAHRLAFFKAHGYWPEVCRHKCDNPPCINPDHLLDGTHADNHADMMERGRAGGLFPPGHNLGTGISDDERRRRNADRMRRLKSKCKRGHPLGEGAPGKTRSCYHPDCVEARRYNYRGKH